MDEKTTIFRRAVKNMILLVSGIINWLLADMTRLVGRRTGTVYQVLNRLLTTNF